MNVSDFQNQFDECINSTYIELATGHHHQQNNTALCQAPDAQQRPEGDNNLLEIIIQGRGGQGAQTAGNLLASAFHAQGLHVQSFASYGGARRGTPVNSHLRVDDRPIRLRCDIERADAILCFDASLLEGRLLATADDNTLIVTNSTRSVAEFASILPGKRVIPIDALSIARQQGLGRIVNSALLGALARAIKAPTLAVLTQTLVDNAPKQHDENIAACTQGYHCAERLLLETTP
ncbi:MAG: hypothetical protein AUJ20_10060 [Comamonadaceae bacterium CG1_02_60_18]|nr:MAG: hypothetical protein AUJ20_10060 [Comamonadaceae bacterium CG1_02_60_18]